MSVFGRLGYKQRTARWVGRAGTGGRGALSGGSGTLVDRCLVGERSESVYEG